MNQRIKVGNFYLEIPKENSLSGNVGSVPAGIKAEKPDEPEAQEEPQYIYRPNDPFQSSIDEARAITSISATHKPWVRKTWFILFVIGPLVWAELFALALAVKGDNVNPWLALLISNILILPVWTIYYMIWRKKMRR